MRDPINIENVIDYLGEKILEAKYTEAIAENFLFILPVIVAKKYDFTGENEPLMHKKKCVTLAKLLRYSSDIQRFVSMNNFS